LVISYRIVTQKIRYSMYAQTVKTLRGLFANPKALLDGTVHPHPDAPPVTSSKYPGLRPILYGSSFGNIRPPRLHILSFLQI
jgi:hypothetical protein